MHLGNLVSNAALNVKEAKPNLLRRYLAVKKWRKQAPKDNGPEKNYSQTHTGPITQCTPIDSSRGEPTAPVR